MAVVNVRKAELVKRGIGSFEEWSKKPNTVYIGRNMEFYVQGTSKSKWHNPYTVKKYGLEECLKLYEEHVRANMMDKLHELQGKELGCWCHPDRCHGDVLIKLMNEHKNY